jgi:hypothetical protein
LGTKSRVRRNPRKAEILSQCKGFGLSCIRRRPGSSVAIQLLSGVSRDAEFGLVTQWLIAKKTGGFTSLSMLEEREEKEEVEETTSLFSKSERFTTLGIHEQEKSFGKSDLIQVSNTLEKNGLTRSESDSKSNNSSFKDDALVIGEFVAGTIPAFHPRILRRRRSRDRNRPQEKESSR